MPRTDPWNDSVSRVELDQRSREARLRLERIERLLTPRSTVTNSGAGGPLVFIASADTAAHRDSFELGGR